MSTDQRKLSNVTNIFIRSTAQSKLPFNSISNTNRREYATKQLPNYQEIEMPALSPTMTKGGVSRWAVKEGDRVLAGDVLAEIQTDKAAISKRETKSV